MDIDLTSCTDAAALAAAIAHRCPQARQHGDQWQACCPAHDDSTPSLSITPAADKVLLYCHAQCPLDAILAALGLTRRDLFVHGSTPHNGHRRIVTTYDYVDADGVLVHQTVRLTPKAFRQRRPLPRDARGVAVEPGGRGACPLSPPASDAGDPMRRAHLCGRGGKRRRGPAGARANRDL